MRSQHISINFCWASSVFVYRFKHHKELHVFQAPGDSLLCVRLQRNKETGTHHYCLDIKRIQITKNSTAIFLSWLLIKHQSFTIALPQTSTTTLPDSSVVHELDRAVKEISSKRPVVHCRLHSFNALATPYDTPNRHHERLFRTRTLYFHRIRILDSSSTSVYYLTPTHPPLMWSGFACITFMAPV